MAQPIIPAADDAAAKELAANIAVFKASPAVYGITPEDATALEAQAAAFATHVAEVTAQKALLGAAVQRKDAARALVSKNYRALVARIQVNPAVSDAGRAAANIPVRDTVKTSAQPPAPMDLVVSPQANGTHFLAWNRGGADKNTDFLIEAKVGTATTWTLIGHSKGVNFEHKGQHPRRAHRVSRQSQTRQVRIGLQPRRGSLPSVIRREGRLPAPMWS